MNNDAAYSEEEIGNRVASDKNRKTTMVIVALVVGLVSLLVTAVVVGGRQ